MTLAALAPWLCPARAFGQAQRDVLAQGSQVSDDLKTGDTMPVWVATVDASRNPPEPITTVLLRERFGDVGGWLSLRGLPARAVALTSHRLELVMLLKPAAGPPREWAWISRSGDTERFSYGPMLPGKASILAIAGDSKSLWAIGPAVRPATTSSTTIPTLSTQPTTRPSWPVLYQLVGAKWVARPAQWPDDQDLSPNQMSMVLIGQKPVLAILTNDDQYAQLLILEQGRWKKLDRVPVRGAETVGRDFKLRDFKLLNMGEQPALWLQPEQPQEALGSIWTQKQGQRVRLTLAGPQPAWRDVDVTVAGEQVRLFVKRGGILVEQRYGFDLKPSGEPVEVKPRKLGPVGQLDGWITIAVMAVLSVFILNILVRRRGSGDRDENQSDSEE